MLTWEYWRGSVGADSVGVAFLKPARMLGQQKKERSRQIYIFSLSFAHHKDCAVRLLGESSGPLLFLLRAEQSGLAGVSTGQRVFLNML